MKKLGALALTTVILSSLAISASAARGLVYTAQYGTATIDGVMEDTWLVNGSEWTEIDLPHNSEEANSICQARAKMMHDDNLLYFLVEITDATLANSDDLALTVQDQFEIYLDEDNCKDVAYCDDAVQFGMCLSGDVREGTNAEGKADMVKEFKVGTSANGYVLEFSVALQNGIPAPGQKIGLEFMYNDNDVDGTFLEALRWNVDTYSGDSAPWQSLEYWGELECAEYVAPAEPEVDEPAVDAPVDAPAEAPVTADAGIVAAAAVMAIAAGVVLSKKH